MVQMKNFVVVIKKLFLRIYMYVHWYKKSMIIFN